MQHLTMQQTADYLEAAIIMQTIDAGHVVVHVGVNASGTKFVLVNDCAGASVVSESL